MVIIIESIRMQKQFNVYARHLNEITSVMYCNSTRNESLIRLAYKNALVLGHLSVVINSSILNDGVNKFVSKCSS